VIALIPVSRFSVRYEVGAGRPYSKLEELMLQAIALRATGITLDELRQTFRVHDRLIIESIVTLVRAGWVALAGSDCLVPTAEGAATAKRGDRPQGTVNRGARANLIMERVCGLVCSEAHDQVNVRSRRELTSALGGNLSRTVKLAVRHTRNSLDEGQVQQLLPKRPREWIRWIGPIEMQSRDYHFVPVYIDAEHGEINGLPRSWEPLLRGILLDETRRRMDEDKESAIEDLPALLAGRRRSQAARTRQAEEYFRAVDISPEDLLWDTAQVEQHVARMLSRAQTTFLLVVPTIDTATVEALEKPAAEALQRNVNIDVLWGRTIGDSVPKAGPISALKRIAATNPSGSGKRLRFNVNPSNVNSRIVIADGPEGLEAIIGGTGPLLSGRAPRPIVPALRIREPALIAEVVQAAAGWWAGTAGEELSSTVDRLRRLASECKRILLPREKGYSPETNEYTEGSDESPIEVRTAPKDTARVIIGTEYALAEAALLDGARQRLMVITPSPADVTSYPLSIKLTATGASIPEITMASPAYQDEEKSPEETALSVLLLGDDKFIVGCHHPFPSLGNAPTHSELSVEVHGPSAATVWDHVFSSSPGNWTVTPIKAPFDGNACLQLSIDAS
jgi:hypothetical protein